MDLSGLNLPQLYKLQKDLETEIVRRKETDKVTLINELQQLAAAKGFSLNEVLGLEGKKIGKKAASASKAQYRNPNDHTQTWSGRGRKPQWAIDWLGGGNSLDDLRV